MTISSFSYGRRDHSAAVVFSFWLLVSALLSSSAAGASNDLGDALGLADSAALRATIFGPAEDQRAALPDSVPLREINIDIEGGLPVPDLYWFNRKLRAYFSPQKGPAPLAIVIAGTGGSANGNRIRILRRALYQDGHHVLTLPSATFPRFIVAASSTGVAGDLWQDGLDLHRAIIQILTPLQSRHEFTEINILGYSLGGAHAAMVKAIADQKDSPNVRRAVMINPPVSLFSSVDRLDRLLELSIGDDEAAFDRFYHEVYTELSRLYSASDTVTVNQHFLLGAASQLLESERNLAAGISLSFRLSLLDLFFAGDLYAGTGVVVDPDNLPTNASLDDISQTLRHHSFALYIDRVFVPFYMKHRPGSTRESLIADNHLNRIGDQLRNNPDYYAQTNADELILNAEELAWLREAFGTRLVVYERGGHLGNLGEKQQIEDMLDMVSGRYPEPGLQGVRRQGVPLQALRPQDRPQEELRP